MTEQSKFQELLNKNKFNPETVIPKEEAKDDDLRRSYKLKNGLNEWRILPWEDGSIIQKIGIHMNLGVPFFCPNKLDKTEKCPDCDFGWKLYNDNGKQHTEESRNFLSQEKWVIRGIARSEEKEDIAKYGHPRIRFLDSSPTNGKTVEAYFAPAQIKKWGNLSDYSKGRDIELTKDEAKAKARQASTSIERAAIQTSVFTDVEPDDPKFEEMFVKMYETAIPNEARFERKTYKEILELMDNFRRKNSSRNNSSDDSSETEDFSVQSSGFSAASGSLETNEDLDAVAKRF